VAIVTSAPHREEAYAANRHVIEAIKERLPIWKRERFADGSEWKRPGA
jgi:molybdopterin synthase catalytic subunit